MKCFIGLYDILGFKSLRNSLGSQRLFNQYTNFINPIIQHSAANGGIVTNNGYLPKNNPLSIRYKIFSDTVLFLTNDDSFDSFFKITLSSKKLLQFSYGGTKMTFRGAIGYGDFYEYNDIFLGTAIEDAYISESKQVWSGCMLTKDCVNFITANDYVNIYKRIFDQDLNQTTDPDKIKRLKEARELFLLYDVPIYNNPKTGAATYSKEETYVINWAVNLSIPNNNIHTSFNNPGTSSHAKMIINNTQDFFTFARNYLDSI